MNDFAHTLRRAAEALLPPGAFLRRDRGAALYVTDAPRMAVPGGAAADWAAAGFLHGERGGLMVLTPSEKWLRRLEETFVEPPDFLCASFRRFAGRPDMEALRLFARGVKALDGGADDPRYARLLRQRAAVCLREHLPGGGLYACALVNHMIEKERGI